MIQIHTGQCNFCVTSLLPLERSIGSVAITGDNKWMALIQNSMIQNIIK